MPVSVALKVGTMPGTALLVASFKVMVTVEVATPLATTEPVPVMVELRATGADASNTTVPSAFDTGVAMLKVFVSAVLDARVQVDTPKAVVELQAP